MIYDSYCKTDQSSVSSLSHQMFCKNLTPSSLSIKPYPGIHALKNVEIKKLWRNFHALKNAEIKKLWRNFQC